MKLNNALINEAIKKSISRVLKEGTTDEEVNNKWEWLMNNIGGDEMARCLQSWLDSDTLEEIVGWFEEEDYLEGYYEEFGYGDEDGFSTY